MSYATPTDFEAYVEGWTTTDAPALDRLLARAERDIDGLASVLPTLDDTTGHKFDPAAMSARDADVLKRATCAQAEYRFTMGEDFMRRAQLAEVQGPDFTTKGTLPYIGPKVMRELAGTDLIPLSTQAVSGQTADRPPWYSFAYNDPNEP